MNRMGSGQDGGGLVVEQANPMRWEPIETLLRLFRRLGSRGRTLLQRDRLAPLEAWRAAYPMTLIGVNAIAEIVATLVRWRRSCFNLWRE
jgi:hypothetical protein